MALIVQVSKCSNFFKRPTPCLNFCQKRINFSTFHCSQIQTSHAVASTDCGNLHKISSLMEDLLKRELEQLCHKIAAEAGTRDLEELVEAVEEIHEKLMVAAYLTRRETRFMQRTQQIKQQLAIAVAERPLKQSLPPLSAERVVTPAQTTEATAPEPAPEPSMLAEAPDHQMAKSNKTPTEPDHNQPKAASPEVVVEAPKNQQPETMASETIKAPQPEPEIPPAPPVKEARKANVEIQTTLFEPDTVELPSGKMDLKTADFVQHPEPVITAKKATPMATQTATSKAPEPKATAASIADKMTRPGTSLNERLNKKTINIGLNDRLAFVKHLFAGNQEDYNRVISQLNTQASHEDALAFLETFVKPDYDWSAKEIYEERLLEIIRIRFEA
jgi:hypothetical protein